MSVFDDFSNGIASLHPSSVIKRQILHPDKRSSVINKYADLHDPNIEVLAFQELSRLDSGLTVINKFTNYILELNFYFIKFNLL